MFSVEYTRICNYSGMLIGRPIAILYFRARKITVEGAEGRGIDKDGTRSGIVRGEDLHYSYRRRL